MSLGENGAPSELAKVEGGFRGLKMFWLTQQRDRDGNPNPLTRDHMYLSLTFWLDIFCQTIAIHLSEYIL